MTQAQYVPPPIGATRPYWDAARDRELVLQRCAACGRLIHHPREACPTCLGQEFTWDRASGRGTVHATSVHHVPFGQLTAEECPYVVAFVDLEEGVRILTNLVGDGADEVHSGDPVVLAWSPLDDGHALPVFTDARPPGSR